MSADPVKQWEVASSTGKHFDALDGIRGVAILMVVLYHSFYTNPGSGVLSRQIGNLLGAGRMGVPIFFALSGLLISYPFFRQRASDDRFWRQKGYARRRLGKIFPPYYLSIAVFTLYYYLRFSDRAYLVTALKWALGLPNFISTPLHFNVSYWSLLVEIHFYIILPLLFLFTRGLKVRRAAWWMFAALAIVPLAVRWITWPQEASSDRFELLMARFPCQLDYFAWGVLFSGIYVSSAGDRRHLRGFASLGYAGILLLVISAVLWAVGLTYFDIVVHPTRWSLEAYHLLPALSAFLILFFIFDPECIGSRFFASPSLRFIGLVSYEWFLFSEPVTYLFAKMIGNTNGSVMRYAEKTILPLILTFGLSVVIYKYFSLPLLNRIRGRNRTPTEKEDLRSPQGSNLQFK